MIHISWILLVGYGIMAVGSGWIVYIAFKESWLQGLLCIGVPAYIIYFIVSRWEKARDPFLVHLLGWIVFFMGIST